MDEKWEEYKDLQRKSFEADITWIRQILTLAAGAFALLVGLGLDVPPEGSARYFLAATWVCLGLGVVAGGAATYLGAHFAEQDAVDAFFEARLKTDTPPSPSRTFEWTTTLLSLCKPLMVVSLLAAVIFLATYAVMTTLEGGEYPERSDGGGCRDGRSKTPVSRMTRPKPWPPRWVRGHRKVCSYDYGKEASSLGSTHWGACSGSVSSPCQPPVSSYSIVFGAIAPPRVTAPRRVCTRDGVAGARNCRRRPNGPRLVLTAIFTPPELHRGWRVVRSSDEVSLH